MALASAPSPASFVEVVEALFAAPGARETLGSKGRARYEEALSIERTVDVLLGKGC